MPTTPALPLLALTLILTGGRVQATSSPDVLTSPEAAGAEIRKTSVPDAAAAAETTEAEASAPEAQAPAEANAPAAKPYGWRRIGEDLQFLVTRPLHPDRKDRWKMWGVAGGTVALYLLRDEIREEIQEDRTQAKLDSLEVPRTMGKGAFAPGLALVLYTASFATQNVREKETAFLLLESMGASALGAGVGSFVLAAERPEDGESIQFFDIDGHGVSLDVSLAASVIPPLRRAYFRWRPEDGGARRFWKGTATGILYTGVVLTAFQRMYADKHWAPDVFLGAVNGLGMGAMLCEAHDRAVGGAARLSLAPVRDGLGVSWAIPLGRQRVGMGERVAKDPMAAPDPASREPSRPGW